MKKLIVKQAKFKDWRVFSDYTIDFSDSITTIKGDNEAGKTNVASGITWVFNGTSIDGNNLVDVIPTNRIDEHPSPKVTLECVVIDTDTGKEKPATLEREYKAVFLKDKSYKEHKTVTYINGVEMTIAKFNDWISTNVCDIEMFNMLCNVKMFTEQLKPKAKELVWQRQRRIIEQLVDGKVSEESKMAKTNPEFESLCEPIARYEKATEYLKAIRTEQTNLDKLIDRYPNSIEYIENDIVDTTYTLDDLEKDKAVNQRTLTTLEHKNEEYRASKQNKASAELANSLSELQAQLKIENDKYTTACNKFLSQKNELNSEIQRKKFELKTANDNLERARKDYADKASSKITGTCDKCGQTLPAATIEKFKAQKVKELEEMKTAGVAISALVAQIEKDITALESKMYALVSPKRPAILDELSGKAGSITTQLSEQKTIENMPDYEMLRQSCIDKFAEIARKETILERNTEKQKQLEEAKSEHLIHIKRQSELQRSSDICKEFISYRCGIIEEKINSLFDGIKFKMFRMNKGDGELKETFEIYFNGKQYGDSLSLSTKLLVSYWITKSLQKALGVYVPIVLDNMESVSFHEGNVDTQLIILEKIEQNCPNCNSTNTGRRTVNGKWICADCGNEFTKELIVEKEQL